MASEQAQEDLDAFQARLSGRPVVTYALLALNAAAFGWLLAHGAGFMSGDGEVLARWGSNFGPLTSDGQWWRLLTATFLHSGAMHFVFNMWALHESGGLAERLFGWRRFLALYLVAGLGGSIASLLWNPVVNSVGASGAIFGVFGALLVFMLNRANGVPLAVMKQSRISTLAFIAYSLAYGMSHAGIDNAAHLGGLVAGAAMGLLLARPLQERDAPGGRRLALALGVAVLALGVAASAIRNTGVIFRAEQAYREDVNWFIGEEDRLVKTWLAQRERMKGYQGDPADFAADMERLLVRPWSEAHDRLAAHPLGAASSLHRHQAILIRYTGSRRDAFREFAKGIRSNSTASQGAVKALFESGDEAIRQLKQMAEEKKKGR